MVIQKGTGEEFTGQALSDAESLLSDLVNSLDEQVRMLGGTGRGGGTRRLAEARSRASGKSVKTEQRAIQRALKSGKAPRRQSASVAKAGARQARARQIRTSSGAVDVGQVAVYSVSKGVAQGTRMIRDPATGGPVRLSQSQRDQVADLIEQGETEAAGEKLSDFIMDTYGAGSGNLYMTDFSGIDFI